MDAASKHPIGAWHGRSVSPLTPLYAAPTSSRTLGRSGQRKAGMSQGASLDAVLTLSQLHSYYISCT